MIIVPIASAPARARFWVNELPPALYRADSCIQDRHRAFAPSRNVPGALAIEMMIPRGARILYGLLGIQIRPLSTADLVTSIGVRESTDTGFGDAISTSIHDAAIGMPREFALAVRTGMKQEIQSCDEVPALEIVATCGAHDPVGSCKWLFERLAAILTRCALGREALEPATLGALMSRHGL